MFNASRHLFKLWDADHNIIAAITGQGEVDVLTKYREAGGEVDQPQLEQVSHGYPVDVIEVYA